MIDRIPTKPNRVKITPEGGDSAYYATMTRADEPTNEGTPLKKGTLLADATAGYLDFKYGTTPDTVNEALLLLAAGSLDIACITLKALIPNGDILVTNTQVTIYKNNVSTLLTSDSSGKVYLPITAGDVIEAKLNSPAFPLLTSEKVTITESAIIGEEYSVYLAELTDDAYYLTSSGTYTIPEFMQNLEIDVCCVGGGGSGGGANSSYVYGSGGGGGYTTNEYGITLGEQVTITVGAGGEQIGGGNYANGNAGGVTSYIGTTTVSADGGRGGLRGGGSSAVPGGAGGSGGGAAGGGSPYGGVGGSNGSDGKKDYNGYLQTGGVGQGTTTYPFGDTSLLLMSGGGGGARAGTGGAGGGGNGAGSASEQAGHGTDGRGGGGGGGQKGSLYSASGKGGSGCVVIRFSA